MDASFAPDGSGVEETFDDIETFKLKQLETGEWQVVIDGEAVHTDELSPYYVEVNK